jgi:hypothetical protein
MQATISAINARTADYFSIVYVIEVKRTYIKWYLHSKQPLSFYAPLVLTNKGAALTGCSFIILASTLLLAG